MAGTLRPSSDLLKSDKEAGYIIHQYVLYDQAENLFNGGMETISTAPFKGTVSRTNARFTYWYTANNYLDIEFLNDVRIWDAGGEVADYTNELKIFSNESGKKGSLVGMLKKYTKSYNANKPNWQEVAVLEKGRYRIEYSNGTRISNEWYLENLEATNKTLILHDGKYKKVTPKVDAFNGKVTPKMTSNTTPSPFVVTSSGEQTVTTNAYRAFDGTKSTDASNGWASLVGATDRWLQIKLDEPYVVNHMRIHIPYPYNSPLDFELLGSNNGSDFTRIMLRENEPAWAVEERRYDINNTTPYNYYRLNVIRKQGSGVDYVMIGEFELYSFLDEIPSKTETVSSTLPTSTQFLSDGMDSLSPLLDRRIETLEPLVMTDKSEILNGGEGKVFSKKLDLKKYIDLRQIKVEVE